ncbi:hypothetical protein, partial [Aeromonas salmonicida]
NYIARIGKFLCGVDIGCLEVAQGSPVLLVSWIYGFSDNNQSFAYSGSRQPIRACDGQLTCRRALVLGSSDPVTGRRGEQRWLFALATRACALFATYGLQPG